MAACSFRVSTLLLSAFLLASTISVDSHDVGVLAFLKDALGDPPVLSEWSWGKEPCEPLYQVGVKRCNQTQGCHTIGDENISEERQNCRVLELDLSGLKLTGVLTFVLGDMWRLEVLDMSNNAIRGPLPDGKQGLSLMAALQSINLANNQLTGNLTVLGKNKPVLSYVNVSNNAFEGELPPTWATLAANGTLKTLDVSGNRLSGRVPDEMSKVAQFVYLPGNEGLCNDAFPGLPPCDGSPRSSPIAAAPVGIAPVPAPVSALSTTPATATTPTPATATTPTPATATTPAPVTATASPSLAPVPEVTTPAPAPLEMTVPPLIGSVVGSSPGSNSSASSSSTSTDASAPAGVVTLPPSGAVRSQLVRGGLSVALALGVALL